MYEGAFGERLGRSFHIGSPPTLQSQTKRGSRLAVTELRIDKAGYGMTSPMGSDDAYLICLNLKQQTAHELWCDGRYRVLKCLWRWHYLFARLAARSHRLHRRPFALPLFLYAKEGGW